MEKKPTIAQYISRVERECQKENLKVPKIEVDAQVRKNNYLLGKVIKNEMQDYFTLLDLGISAIIEMHYICKGKPFVYQSITAKFVSQLLSMRTLLYQGQMDSVKIIHRSLHEMIEVFFACLIDKSFAEKYGNPNVIYDNNEFWKININGNKLDQHINKLFDEVGYRRESKKEYFKRRERTKKFLSEAIHASFNSTFATYLMFTMDKRCSDNLYGEITTAYPMAMYELLTDICLINAVFFMAVDQEKAFAFSKNDIIGEDKIKYNHYMKLYDTTYDLYFQDLYKKAYDISEALKEIHKIVKELEEKQNITDAE